MVTPRCQFSKRTRGSLVAKSPPNGVDQWELDYKKPCKNSYHRPKVGWPKAAGNSKRRFDRGFTVIWATFKLTQPVHITVITIN